MPLFGDPLFGDPSRGKTGEQLLPAAGNVLRDLYNAERQRVSDRIGYLADPNTWRMGSLPDYNALPQLLPGQAREAWNNSQTMQDLLGESLLPIPGFLGRLRGIKRWPKMYHGTQVDLDTIMEEGFQRGSSAELHIPGTSMSEDPVMSMKVFAARHPDWVLGVDPQIPPSEVYNLSPSAYMTREVPGDFTDIYRKPGLFAEAETFARRGKRYTPEMQSRQAELEKTLIETENEMADLWQRPPGPATEARRTELSGKRMQLMNELGALQEGAKTTRATPRRLTVEEQRRIAKADEAHAYARSALGDLLGDSDTIDYNRVRQSLGKGLRNLKGHRAMQQRFAEELLQPMQSWYRPDRRLHFSKRFRETFKQRNPAEVSAALNDLWTAGSAWEKLVTFKNDLWSKVNAGGEVTQATKDAFDATYRTYVKERNKALERLERLAGDPVRTTRGARYQIPGGPPEAWIRSARDRQDVERLMQGFMGP